MYQKGDVQFYLLNPEQYLCVCEASSKDSYRAPEKMIYKS